MFHHHISKLATLLFYIFKFSNNNNNNNNNNNKCIIQEIQEIILRWFSHIMRRVGTAVNKVFHWEPSGKKAARKTNMHDWDTVYHGDKA